MAEGASALGVDEKRGSGSRGSCKMVKKDSRQIAHVV